VRGRAASAKTLGVELFLEGTQKVQCIIRRLLCIRRIAQFEAMNAGNTSGITQSNWCESFSTQCNCLIPMRIDLDEPVPGEADVVAGFEDAVGQPVFAHELPDIFDRVRLRAPGRRRHERDVGRYDQFGRSMPYRLIELDERRKSLMIDELALLVAVVVSLSSSEPEM